MSTDRTPITRTYGHGGIKLTAYPSSGRVGVEVTAENAVMDYSDLLDFADQIRKPREVRTAAELDALPVGSVVLDDLLVTYSKPYNAGNFWLMVGDEERHPAEHVFLPATILHEPTT